MLGVVAGVPRRKRVDLDPEGDALLATVFARRELGTDAVNLRAGGQRRSQTGKTTQQVNQGHSSKQIFVTSFQTSI